MRPRPVQWATMRPSNGTSPRIADSSVVLPAPFGPNDRVQRAPLDGERKIREQCLARRAQRETRNLEQRIFEQEIRRIGVTLFSKKCFFSYSPNLLFHFTSARIIVSAFCCISRSNLSAVNGPDAMWLMT